MYGPPLLEVLAMCVLKFSREYTLSSALITALSRWNVNPCLESSQTFHALWFFIMCFQHDCMSMPAAPSWYCLYVGAKFLYVPLYVAHNMWWHHKTCLVAPNMLLADCYAYSTGSLCPQSTVEGLLVYLLCSQSTLRCNSCFWLPCVCPATCWWHTHITYSIPLSCLDIQLNHGFIFLLAAREHEAWQWCAWHRLAVYCSNHGWCMRKRLTYKIILIADLDVLVSSVIPN